MEGKEASILIIGAGVNGSACATILHKSGIDITLLARGERYEEIRENGIIIENPLNHTRSVEKVKVVNTLNPTDFYDYIFVIMRKNQALELLPVLAVNCSPNIVFMGNTLSSPEEYTTFLGKDRVLMGSVYAGGRREGNVIKAMVSTKLAVPFGEINGTITPRIERLVTLLNQGISRAQISTHIVDELITHSAAVIPIGYLVLKHGSQTRNLAKSTTDLYLLVDAIRDGFKVLQKLGFQILPKSNEFFFNYVPKFILVTLMRVLFNSKFGQVGIEYHVSQAPDEMQHLAKEMRTLVEKAGLPVPALREVLDMK